MKQIFKEIIKNVKFKDKINIKRYYYDTRISTRVVIVQTEKIGFREKKISEMRIPLVSATDKVKNLVSV